MKSDEEGGQQVNRPNYGDQVLPDFKKIEKKKKEMKK
jgi:hypothetical protein